VLIGRVASLQGVPLREESGAVSWPVEASDCGLDARKKRQPRPLHYFERTMTGVNAKLREGRQPPMLGEELAGARMYTGPLFYKYNTVLRSTAHHSTA
jgi:hypothetical protein